MNSEDDELTYEELGDVLYACRQIARKSEREAEKAPTDEIYEKNMRRSESLRAAMRKLRRLFEEGEL